MDVPKLLSPGDRRNHSTEGKFGSAQIKSKLIYVSTVSTSLSDVTSNC